MSHQIQRQRLSDVVVDRIKHYIVENQLSPGDRLPTEHSLAERFGVSRISIREATKALGYFGILNAKPGRGLTVGHIDMDRVSECLGFQLATIDYPKLELIESRIVVETGVLPHVIRRMQEDPEVYENLNRINHRLRKTRLIEDRVKIDIQFHRALLAASGLGPLVAFNDLLQMFFNHFRQSLKKGAWKVGVEVHQKIIDALHDGNLEVACDEVRKHIAYHKESYLLNR